MRIKRMDPPHALPGTPHLLKKEVITFTKAPWIEGMTHVTLYLVNRGKLHFTHSQAGKIFSTTHAGNEPFKPKTPSEQKFAKAILAIVKLENNKGQIEL